MENCGRKSLRCEVKCESFSGVCQCCLLSANNLRNMLQIFFIENKQQSYSDMLCCSFAIELMDCEDSLCLICERCILKLRDSYIFRHQIEDSQRKLKQQNKLLFEEYYDSENRVKNETFSKNHSFSGDENSFDADLYENRVKEEPISKNESFFDVEIYDYDAENCDDESSSDYKDNEVLKRGKDLPESTTKSWDSKQNTSNNVKKSLPKANFNIAKLSAPINRRKPKTQAKSIKSVASIKNSTRKKSKLKTLSEKDIALNKQLKRERQQFLKTQRRAKIYPFVLEASAVSCNECNETFPTHKHLVCHMAVHFPNHICDLCGKLYVSKDRLISHINNTHDDKKIACQICHKLLKKTSMARHVRSHTGDNSIYKCRFCHIKFVSYSTRIVHMRKVHNILGSVYKCKMCPKSFEISGYLSKHVRKYHFQEKNHTCTFCNQSFYSKHDLKTHLVAHTGEKNFQCKVCSKTYSRRQALNTHLKIHSNIKNHVCQICDKAFTQKCTLQGHMKVHEKPKLFSK